MPAAKPKEKQRVRFNIVCSLDSKQKIDASLSHIKKKFRSKYILTLIKEAIDSKNTDLIEESYTHGTSTQFQVSCTPEEKKSIDDFCDRYLDAHKRSRWIVSLVTSPDVESKITTRASPYKE